MRTTLSLQCILSEDDRDKLQECMNLLSKCKILHVGHNNPKYDYYMNGTKQLEVCEEKEIGVKVSCDLKP